MFSIKESGRAADLVADLYAIFSKDSVDYISDNEENVDDKSLSSCRPSFASATLRVTEVNAM